MRRAAAVQILAAGALLSFTSAVEAQERRGPGGYFGVSFVGANAIGDFRTFVDNGFGMQLEGGIPSALDGHVRLRADLGFVVYGLERQSYCYGLSCRVASDLTTTNSIIYGGVGPELVLATGALEPYVHASAGLAGFVTSSSLNDHDGYGPYGETTNYSDVVFGLAYGGGLRMRVGGSRRPVFIDLGVELRDNGVARFLTVGDIVDNPDGSITVYPNTSDTDLMTFRVGFTVGFPSGRHRDHGPYGRRRSR